MDEKIKSAPAPWGMWAFLRALPRLLFPHLGWFLLSVLALAPGVLMATGMPLLLRALVDRALAAGNPVIATYALAVIALLAILDVGTGPVQRWLASRMATAGGNDRRIRIFSHLQKLSVGYYETRQPRLLADLATGGAGAVESALEDALLRAIKQIAIIGFGLFLLFTLEPRLALACGLLLPVVPVGLLLLLLGAKSWIRYQPKSTMPTRINRRTTSVVPVFRGGPPLFPLLFGPRLRSGRCGLGALLFGLRWYKRSARASIYSNLLSECNRRSLFADHSN